MSDSKETVTIEQALAVIDRVSAEVGLLRGETSGFYKIQGPSNKHRLYVQKSRNLTRIDCTIPLAADDPAFVALVAPNGSISCQVKADLEQLERALRMLGDSALATQVPNKPRPFAAQKNPGARRPKAVAPPIAGDQTPAKPKAGDIHPDLAARLEVLKSRAREAKIGNVMENPELYGERTRDEVADWLDSKRTLAELRSLHQDTVNNLASLEANEAMAEAGIEVSA